MPTSEAVTSSAPASAAIKKSSSSSMLSGATTISPRLSKTQATHPRSPILPSCLVRACRIAATARLRLSVKTSIIIATPPGP